MQTVVARHQTAIDSEVQTLSQRVLLAEDLNSYDAGVVFAEVDSSVVDGPDIIKGDYDTVTEWDKYAYADISDYLISYEFERESDFPLQKVVKAKASIVLDKTKGAWYDLKVGRFLKILAGYYGFTIPQFVGKTQKPEHDINMKTTTINSYDILEYLDNYEMAGSIYTNVTGSEAIDNILTEIGFTAGQYILENSPNLIPFVWIKRGDRALDIIRKICEAENAVFYVDEFGIMRFENRYHLHLTSTPQATFHYGNITNISLEPTEVINKVYVKGYPREVQSSQIVWQKGNAEVIPAGGTLEIWADISDDYGELPCTNIYEPDSSGTNGSYFTGNASADGSDTNRTSSISVTTWETFGSTAHIILTNAYGSDIYLTELVLYGTPAKVTSEIEYETEDNDSMDEYGIKTFTINNDFIQSNDQARNLAQSIVHNFENPKSNIEIEVKGLPNLQLNDLVRVEVNDTGTAYNTYVRKITKLTNGYLHRLLLTNIEVQNYAIVDISTVDGSDVVAP